MNDMETREENKPSKPSFGGPITMVILAAISAGLGRLIAKAMESAEGGGGLYGAIDIANKRARVMGTFDIIAGALVLIGVILLVRALVLRKRVNG